VIDTQFIDHQFGDWYKSVDLQGKPILTAYKVGPWECPYHHIRACFEMVERLE
jgi:mannobiose 2-epimerase